MQLEDVGQSSPEPQTAVQGSSEIEVAQPLPRLPVSLANILNPPAPSTPVMISEIPAAEQPSHSLHQSLSWILNPSAQIVQPPPQSTGSLSCLLNTEELEPQTVAESTLAEVTMEEDIAVLGRGLSMEYEDAGLSPADWEIGLSLIEDNVGVSSMEIDAGLTEDDIGLASTRDNAGVSTKEVDVEWEPNMDVDACRLPVGPVCRQSQIIQHLHARKTIQTKGGGR